MKYGLPYKGSKNKLAERIVRLLPKRTHLVDLFCGGCAVSHAAMVMGKYKHIHINDINWMCPTLFIDAINGKYNNESRWISREEFFRLKDTDPYVAVVWSFGNNMRDYLYSREIEPLKKAIHYALFFSDYSLGKKLGHDLSFIDPIKDLQKRYMAVKHYFNQFGHFQQQSFEGGRITECGSKASTPTYRTGGGKTGRSDCSQWKDKRPSELQHLECVNRVSQLKKKKNPAMWGNGKPRTKERTCMPWRATNGREGCGNVLRGGYSVPITSSVLDYQDVEIPKDSVIYCDIPYLNSNVYNKAEHFDYERFYEWCGRQAEPVFISSYQMPEDRFDCIEEFVHRSTLCATANNQVTERIFVPKHQSERGNKRVQLSLF